MPIFLKKTALRPELSGALLRSEAEQKSGNGARIKSPEKYFTTISPCIDPRAEFCKPVLSAVHFRSC